MKYLRKTKIICTLGPATHTYAKIKNLAKAGMDIARLNFSHGDYSYHKKTYDMIRKVSESLGEPIGVMQDLEGYRIRIGAFKDHKPIILKEGKRFEISSKKKIGNKDLITISYSGFEKYLRRGYNIYIDDGKIKLKVIKVKKNKAEVKVISGGILKEHKGINVPKAYFDFEGISEKDKKDLSFGLKMGIDYVAQSFVRTPDDIKILRRFMKKKGRQVPVFAKIEDAEGVKNIDKIIEVADGIMVARGDMGVCLSLEKVPIIQKKIIHKCNRMGKPVITATQMLDSMMVNKQPTRAEVADVANAIIDGTDLVMLSQETAVGKYPQETVSYMDKIIVNTERSLNYNKMLVARDIRPANNNPSEAMSFGLRNLAQLIDIDAIIVHANSGNTTKVIAKFRPWDPIIAISDNKNIINETLLYWGVQPVFIKDVFKKEIASILKILLKKGMLSKGRFVIFTKGIKPEGIKFGSIDIFKVK